jgi:predicted DsbA family dithiol-disulfide isomerase
MTQPLHIDVVSDYVCPWCFVGKRRLEAAIAQRPDLNIDVNWQPYQLSPDTPREGRNKAEHYEEIFGVDRAKIIRESMKDTGKEEGIAFGSSPDAVSPNTLSAHVLMGLANADDSIDADVLAEKLFYAHHVACENIGAHDVLKRIAGEVGMDTDAVAASLAAGEGEDEVTAQIREASGRGVSGVPFFIVNGEYGISGAQPADALVAAFDQIAASKDSDAASI